MIVTRLGRELWNLDISGNTTVNLWDVDYLDNSNINSFQFINGIDVSGMTVSYYILMLIIQLILIKLYL